MECQRHIGEKISRETRYYLTRLSVKAEPFAQAVRAHRSIEKPLRWMMDVCFRADLCRVRKDYAPANLARVRRLAGAKTSFKGRRRKTGWDNDYLKTLMVNGRIKNAPSHSQNEDQVKKKLDAIALGRDGTRRVLRVIPPMQAIETHSQHFFGGE